VDGLLVLEMADQRRTSMIAYPRPSCGQTLKVKDEFAGPAKDLVATRRRRHYNRPL
jgi:hypothetical protein